eukprot:COSAG02_NODE_13_length_57813_cov_14.298276_9_plen_154_part_00
MTSSETRKSVSFSSTAGGPPVVNAGLSQPLRGHDVDSGALEQHAGVGPTTDALVEQQQQQQQQQFREHQQRSTGSVYGSGSSFKPRDAAPTLESFGSLAAERPAFRQSEPGPDRGIDTGSLDSSLPVGRRGRSESMRDDSFGSMTSVSTGRTS